MKVMVIGANGLVGTDICKAFAQQGNDVIPLTHTQIELTDHQMVRTVIQSLMPDIVVNTAACHDLELCERNPDFAYAVNAVAIRGLAQVCEEIGAYLIHLSTNYVFGGEKRTPYIESDRTYPLSVYGNSKLAGEYYVLQNSEGAVLRTSSIYGSQPCRAKVGGLDFVNFILKSAAEQDEVSVAAPELGPIYTPTYSVDIAQQILVIAKERVKGVLHGAAHGECTWFTLAEEIFKIKAIKKKLIPMELNYQPITRPKYSVLQNHALQSMQLDIMSDWQDGLRRFLSL